MKLMHKKTLRSGLAGLLLSGAITVISGVAVTAVAQEAQPKEPSVTKRSFGGGRDPFRKYEPTKATARKAGQSPIPSLEDRISQYKAQKLSAMNARMQAPKPTTALLISEIQVIGISRTPRGYAAIVEATPIKLSYVIYPGEPFFDGQLVAIEDNRLVFRRETVFANGRRERSVEFKPLRQASPVTSMALPNTATASTSESAATAKP